MRSVTWGALLAALVLGSLAGRASAGPWGPIPVVNGQSPKHVYSVTGVIANTSFQTVFTCTSLEAKDVLVAIEIFSWDANVLNDVTAGAGVATIGPGQTWVIATDGGTPISSDVQIGVVSSMGGARILATSPKIICSAVLVSVLGSPSAMMTALPVIKKTSQKGD